MKKTILLSVLVVLIISLSGCGGNEEIVPTEIPPTAALPTRQVEVTPVMIESSCSNAFLYVDDVNYPDDTIVEAGSVFTKEWEVQNTGNCTWDEGFKLRFVSGEQMNAPDKLSVPSVPVGAKGKISVQLTAPLEAGTYRSEWMLFGSDNRMFGEILYVQIVVQ